MPLTLPQSQSYLPPELDEEEQYRRRMGLPPLSEDQGQLALPRSPLPAPPPAPGAFTNPAAPEARPFLPPPTRGALPPNLEAPSEIPSDTNESRIPEIKRPAPTPTLRPPPAEPPAGINLPPSELERVIREGPPQVGRARNIIGNVLRFALPGRPDFGSAVLGETGYHKKLATAATLDKSAMERQKAGTEAIRAQAELKMREAEAEAQRRMAVSAERQAKAAERVSLPKDLEEAVTRWIFQNVAPENQLIEFKNARAAFEKGQAGHWATNAAGDVSYIPLPIPGQQAPQPVVFKGAGPPAPQQIIPGATATFGLKRGATTAEEIRTSAGGSIVRPVSSGLTGELTPEGLDAAARMFSKTGQLPAMGMGAAGVRTRIINRAAELEPTIDIATNQASFKANQASLAKLQTSRDAVVSFEKTALKNLDLLLKTAKPVIDTGSPLINQPIREVGKSLFGATNFPSFEAARRVAVNEVAKVTSNPNLTGVLSDAARKEVESFVPANATLGQLYSVVKVLRQDMTNRHVSMDEEIAAIRDRIGGAGPPSPSPTVSPIKMRTPNGNIYPVDPSRQKEWEARGAKVVP